MAYNILISDKFDAEGVKKLQEQKDFEVIYDKGYKREEFLKLLPKANGLIIRSATKVDKEAIACAENLKLIIRAGVGVDNIDIPEASRKGIIVMNSPGGNSISTAELAIALMFGLARNIPQSDASMKSGKWEKSKFLGVELNNKTMGIVGLGRIGKEVAARARSLNMNVIGFDPFLPEETLKTLDIQIVSAEEILAQSDFLTVHTPLTETTKDFINKKNLPSLKDGIRLINCARGGIYNEDALAEGLKSGKIAGVALDVLVQEPPPPEHPLLKFENCLLTPHLGASTGDAEFAVAMDTVNQMVDFFTKGIANFALNFPTLDPAAMKFLTPYITGGEKAGKLLSNLCSGDFSKIEVRFNGEISGSMTQPIMTAVIQGALSISMGDEVNSVNAPYLAKDRGIEVSKSEHSKVGGYENSIQVIFKGKKGYDYEISYSSIQGEPMIISIYKQPVEFRPEGILLVIENKDVPKVVGAVGMFLGEHGINIARLELSRDSRGGNARCVLTVDDILGPEALEQLRKMDHILRAVQIDLR